MENEFRYNGPKPQSREAAIIMIADAIEVASRSVTEPNPTRLQGLINDIIKAFRDDDQFEQCELTMGELHTIGESFLRILSGIHYHRVSQGSGQDSSYGWSGATANTASKA
jgi:membrane-associated HD superfamily phosphohydrolase